MQSAQIKSEPFTPPPAFKAPVWVLYLSAGVAAFTAIAYELLLASYATFLLGASIFQYSFVLSLMMASMGVGALLTRRTSATSLESFLGVEILLAWIAAIAIPTLYLTFSSAVPPHAILLLFVIAIGIGIGMEIPLLNAMQQENSGLTTILFYDYFGGFVGGIFFPILLLPELGFFRLAALLSAMNAVLGLIVTVAFRKQLGPRFKIWLSLAVITTTLATVSFFYAEQVRRMMEFGLFKIYQVL